MITLHDKPDMLINPYRFSGGGSNGLLNDLLAYWKMDEASGSRLDAHASYDLSELGTVGQKVGKIGDSADFDDNSSNYLSRVDSAALRFGGKNRSGSMWARFDDLSNNRNLACKWSSTTTNQEFVLRYQQTDGGIEMIWYLSSGDVRFVHTTTIAIDTWYHIAFGRSNSANEIFIAVNGARETLACASSRSGTSPMEIGRLPASSPIAPMDGRIDEFCLHDRYYSQADIDALYNSGNGLSYDNFTV